jgi:CheY-like chemotaxis protein
MLQNLGYKVDVVSDGEEAVRAAATTSYEAILMDCQMPVLDGYEATGEIRLLQQGSRRTPVIAVTASAMQSDQKRCEAAGMDDYLSKPLALKSLSAVLARWARPDAIDPTNGSGGALDDEVDKDVDVLVQNSGPVSETGAVLDAQVVARLERLGEASGENLLGQLATLFLAEADARIVALHQALADHDATAVRSSAHTLSGASANLGATDLARLCANLATDGAAGDLDDGGAKVEAVEAELQRVRCALDLQIVT